MTTTEVDYPTDAWHHFHGRGVWPLGDDADEGVMVEAADEHSWAALRQYLVGERGNTPAEADELARDTKTLRVGRWHYDCGCTAGEHAEHEAAMADPAYTGSGDECGEACRSVGLAPCSDRFAWTPEYLADDEPGGLPVLYLLWA